MFKNQRNCLAQIREAFFPRLALAVRAGYFGAVRDVPWVISFHNRGEFAVHGSSLGPLLILAPTPFDFPAYFVSRLQVITDETRPGEGVKKSAWRVLKELRRNSRQ